MEHQNLNRIKAVLAERGRSGLWLAENMGVAARSVSRWAQNQQQPHLEDLAKIAELLEVSMCDLLTEGAGRNFAAKGSTVYILHISRDGGKAEFSGIWADLADLVQDLQRVQPDFPGVDQVRRAAIEGRAIKCAGSGYIVGRSVIK